MIRWIFFPTSLEPNDYALEVVNVFEKNNELIDSNVYEGQASDIVLAKIRNDLEKIGFRVEKGKKNNEKRKDLCPSSFWPEWRGVKIF